jgi:hypothetical protein
LTSILPRAEKLAAVATVMTAFRKREPDATRDAAIPTVIFDPMVDDTASWLISNTPRKNATFRISNIQCLMVSATLSKHQHPLLKKTFLPPRNFHNTVIIRVNATQNREMARQTKASRGFQFSDGI